MRLVTVVAEWLYLQDTGYNSGVRFLNQDSNVRDFYSRKAQARLPRLLTGYLSNKGMVANVIRGSIRDFVNAHGDTITKENMESLAKRILSNMRHLPR